VPGYTFVQKRSIHPSIRIDTPRKTTLSTILTYIRHQYHLGCSSWRLSFDRGEGVGFDAEPFEVGSGEVKVDVITSVMDLADI
jgi:hypothetical protein